MNYELKACPFCGGEPEFEGMDRLIKIGCKACGYSRAFRGLLQATVNDKPVGNGEYYHSNATSDATAAWNRRPAVDEASNADSARWRMLPAVIEKHQIDYLELLRDIEEELAIRDAHHVSFYSEPAGTASKEAVTLNAAAPDLLKALRFFIEHPGITQLCTPNSKAMELASAAIAKATGAI